MSNLLLRSGLVHRSRIRPGPGPAVVLALLATACSDGTPQAEGVGGEGLSAPLGVVTGEVGPQGTGGTAPLAPLNRSGVAGEVRTRLTDGALVVVLDALRLPGEGEYAAYVFRGGCGGGGASVALLNPIVASRDSTGTTTTILDLTEVPSATPLSVQIRGPGDSPLACGNLPR